MKKSTKYLLIAGVIGLISFTFNVNEELKLAEDLGFDSVETMRAAQDLGFDDMDTFRLASERGFANMETMSTAQDLGFDDMSAYSEYLEESALATVRGFTSIEIMRTARDLGFYNMPAYSEYLARQQAEQERAAAQAARQEQERARVQAARAERERYSLREGCPLRDRQEYATNPGFTAGEIFRIVAERGGAVNEAFGNCNRCASYTRNQLLSYGLRQEAASTVLFDACSNLLESYARNREVWSAMQRAGQ